MCMLYSHPPDDDFKGRILEDHLDSVADLTSRRLVDRKTDTGTNIIKIGKIAGYYHDIGKSTTYFQNYILDNKKNPKNSSLKNHSEISALIGSYYTLIDTDNPRDALVVYLAIRLHHSGFDKNRSVIKEYTTKMDSEGGRAAKEKNRIHSEQVSDIYQNNKDFLKKISKICFDKQLNHKKLIKYIEDRQVKVLKDVFDNQIYEDVLQVWSSLIFADKNDAAETVDKIGKYENFQKRNIDKYLTGTDRTQLNSLREKARKDIHNNFKNSDNNIFTISLPTGFGKTLSGLSAGLEMTEKEDSTLIYALPYTSIIDQTDDVIRDVFNTDPSQPSYTIHHHLSETYNEYEEGSKLDRKDQIRLAKSWDSSIVLTTFVQLFESLLGPRNSAGLKLSSLKNSVIILDEPQSLPIEWWDIVNKLGNMLSEKYDSTIISMTATQPNILCESTELVEDREKYINYLKNNNRVNFYLDNSIQNQIENPSGSDYISHRKLARNIQESDNNTLCVCNTIDSAIEVYNNIQNHFILNNCLEDAYNSDMNTVKYLRKVTDNKKICVNITSRNRTKDRRILIDTLTGDNGLLNNDEYTVKLISTQLIEAGVDISFDNVYRDIAPISSIVQVAGRCNRNNKKETGDVKIVYLEPVDDKDHCPSEYVYQRNTNINQLRPLFEVLDPDEKCINEHKMISEIVNKYYNNISGGNRKYVEWINNYKCDKLSELSMIEQRNSIDVIVPFSKKEKTKKDKFSKLCMNYAEERFELLDEFDSITVSIPVNDENRENIISSCDVIEISKDSEIYILRDSERNYNFDTGLILDDINTGMNRIL